MIQTHTVNQRCDAIMADAERHVEELQTELKLQIMFLPEQVRTMAWKTFVEDFGGSLDKVIENVKLVGAAHSPSSTAAAKVSLNARKAIKVRHLTVLLVV